MGRKSEYWEYLAREIEAWGGRRLARSKIGDCMVLSQGSGVEDLYYLSFGAWRRGGVEAWRRGGVEAWRRVVKVPADNPSTNPNNSPSSTSAR
jgi:hypothetical protein